MLWCARHSTPRHATPRVTGLCPAPGAWAAVEESRDKWLYTVMETIACNRATLSMGHPSPRRNPRCKPPPCILGPCALSVSSTPPRSARCPRRCSPPSARPWHRLPRCRRIPSVGTRPTTLRLGLTRQQHCQVDSRPWSQRRCPKGPCWERCASVPIATRGAASPSGVSAMASVSRASKSRSSTGSPSDRSPPRRCWCLPRGTAHRCRAIGRGAGC